MLKSRIQAEKQRALLARSTRRVGPGVFDFYRQGDCRLRGFLYSILALLLLIVATSPLGPEIVWKNIRLTFATESVVQEEWAKLVERRAEETSSNDRDAIAANALTDHPDPGLTYDDMRDRIIGNAWGSGAFVEGAFFVLFPLLLILIALLTPRFTPIRVDGRRGLVYTWSGGRLWVQKFNLSDPNALDALRTGPIRNFVWRRDSAELSGLELSLTAADLPGKTRKFHLGSLPPSGLHQWACINDAIETILRGSGRDPDWAGSDPSQPLHWTDPLRVLLSFSLRKPSQRRLRRMEHEAQIFLENN